MLNYYLSLIESPDEQDKCTQLYSRYKNIMLKVAYSILKDYHMANDAVHESFITIIRILERIDDVESDRTKNYLITIVQNDALKLYNKRKKLQEDSYNILPFNMKNNLDLELDYISDASIKMTRDLINDLPDIYADILLLKLFNNLSYKQIAQALNINQATARKRYERAKYALNELLTKEELYDR